jgi:hypothetical protein
MSDGDGPTTADEIGYILPTRSPMRREKIADDNNITQRYLLS